MFTWILVMVTVVSAVYLAVIMYQLLSPFFTGEYDKPFI